MPLSRSRSVLFASLAAAIAVVGALLALSSATAQSPGSGRVRIMHASPDAPAVDIFVDGQKAVTALAFPSNTGYVSLPAGPHDVAVFASPSDGSGTPVLEATLQVAAGKDYTVLAVGKLADSTLALLPLEDNNSAPAAGTAHVRLIHASPDAPAVDVIVAGTNTKVFSNVPFKGAGGYAPVPAGTYNLDVNVASSGDTVKSITGLALSEGTVYTVVATGRAAELQVVPLEDAKHTAPAPAAPLTGNGLSASDGSSGQMTILGAGLLALAVAAVAGGVAVRARSRAS
jgi:hypothetical protein